MATAEVTPELPLAARYTTPPGEQNAEPTPSNPKTQDPEKQADENGLTKKDRDNLLFIRRSYKQKWELLRRSRIRKVLRAMEYLKGNQYYVIGPDGYTFQDPFVMSEGNYENSEQGRNAEDYYRYVTNIIQWFERGLVATLAGQVTTIRFQPANAASDKGNRVAEEASRANAYIERLNDERSLQEQKASYLSLDGCYFQYIRPVRDERLSGGRMETLTTEEMEERELSPDRYICSSCGGDMPADQAAVQSQLQCPYCGKPLSDADFHPAIKGQVPVIKAASEVPQMQVRKSIFNSLHVDADPTADSETGDPLMRTPILDLSLEVDVGAMRAMFPAMWDELSGNGDMVGDGMSEMDRIARLRQFSQQNPSGWWTRLATALVQGERPTYSRTWIQPEAFNILPLKEDADRLKGLFPKGCLLLSFNGRYLGIEDDQLTKRWTWGGTRRGFGLYPPAVLDPAMDFQDRLNDAGNTESEYYDRMAVPGVAYDARAVAGKGLAGKYWAVGTWFPVAVRPKEGRTLQSVLWQPQFHMDKGIEQYQQRLITMAQMVVAVPPQIFGGTTPDIDTASGQRQSLGTAKTILGLVWSQIRGESARAAVIAIKCLAENATDEVFDVIRGDDARYENAPIDLDALQNEIDAYPEEEQGFPESIQQRIERWQDLIVNGAKNPMVLSLMDSMKNQRMFARTLLGQDIDIPGEKNRSKVLEDITRLLQGQPIQGVPDPMTGVPTDMPSVIPDKEVDDLSITQNVVKEYVTDNYWQLKEQQPLQFQNILLYLKLAAQFEREKQLANAPPPQPGPPGPPPAQPAAA